MPFSSKIFGISRVMIFTLQQKQSLDSFRLIRKIFSPKQNIFVGGRLRRRVSTDYVIKKFLLWNIIIGYQEETKIIGRIFFMIKKKLAEMASSRHAALLLLFFQCSGVYQQCEVSVSDYVRKMLQKCQNCVSLTPGLTPG